MTTRILIADDHPIVRSGIRNELSHHSEFEVVGEALDGSEALDLTTTLNPDVLLLDINMPGMKSVDVIRNIKSQPNGCRIIVLTAFGDAGTVMGMLRAGIDGYLLKDEDPQTISDAIHSVVAGKTWLSQAVVSTVVAKVNEPDPLPQEDGLTDREQEVLDLMREGKKNREIALHIHTSERTVEFHVSNILKKLGVKSRVDAILQGQKNKNGGL